MRNIDEVTRSFASATVTCQVRRVRLLYLGLSAVQTSSLAKDCGKRQATGPPWPSSWENVRIRARRWRGEESARIQVHRRRMGPS
ncbi:hypothetical protein Y032_0004g1909 [Ancylostoma ceylanicum]|uniref:Uncharacterized protein n=1 Tax=Ancylostoma ceylanicum TaxID=53326 RepID=A0A016VVH8_9BILA|nr:hypothetical protein Y032_0004g1909 [Ancylostoma ceylanicum]